MRRMWAIRKGKKRVASLYTRLSSHWFATSTGTKTNAVRSVGRQPAFDRPRSRSDFNSKHGVVRN